MRRAFRRLRTGATGQSVRKPHRKGPQLAARDEHKPDGDRRSRLSFGLRTVLPTPHHSRTVQDSSRVKGHLNPNKDRKTTSAYLVDCIAEGSTRGSQSGAAQRSRRGLQGFALRKAKLRNQCLTLETPAWHADKTQSLTGSGVTRLDSFLNRCTDG